MGIGDYICVTLRGGAPWGFTIAEGEGDTYRPLVVSKVEDDGRAFLAGIQESDHVVSINGEPCADMTLMQAFALIDTSTDCLQLLLKRPSSTPSEDYDPDETSCGERESSGDAVESTTLHILSPKHRPQSPRELYISESQDEAYYGEMDSDTEIHKGPQPLSTQLHIPSSVLESGNDKVSVSFSPGDMLELQVSLAKSSLDDTDCKSLGNACDTEGEFSNRDTTGEAPITPASLNAPSSTREPLSHHGVVLSSPSVLGQVEVILQGPAASGTGRGIQGVRGGVGGPKVSCGESQSEGEEGAGGVHCEGVPRCFTVSFGIPSEEATETEEPDSDSDSEEDPDRPNKHRARHARLRRSESLSEKQVKEAKSKCKRIALLLKAAPPNPNNKGVLMFKKHRQRAKKFTLVSYGTGEEDPEYRSEEDEDDKENREEAHVVEFTLVPSKDTDSEPHIFTNANSSKGGLSINWDKGLLEIERNLNNQVKMECLPDTKGKGALMFAQRRQRMDEISAEHEELRRQGIPVEGLQEVQKKIEEHSYMQSAIEGHAYMDVNMHQQTQHQQQYQQYQDQQYYEQQQQHYQQQQQYQQQYQQQQYEQQHYQQQQMYQQQQQQQEYHQEHHQEQQQFQQYSANINGTLLQQTNEMQSSLSNRTAKPFSAENMASTPYSPANGNNQESQGEQIASRDERISTPAFRTGILLDTRRKNAGKPMFTFKEAPKVSPNPELLNLLNRSDKKMGFESGPEEDYLSLGAEACNFLQSQRIKNKIPPPVAPKPMINPTAPPWAAQMEMTNQDMPQCAENSLITPAVAPPAEITPAPELEPAPAPAPEPSTPSAPEEVPTSTATEEQHAWSAPTSEPQQQPVQMAEDSVQMNSTLQSEPSPAASWPTAQQQAQQQSSANSWQAQPQLQEIPPSQSPPQPPWVSRQPAPIQAQPQPPTNTWNPQIQQTWGQPQGQVQTQAQPPWVQAQEQPSSQPQIQPPWAHAQEQPHLQPMHPTYGQPQEQMQQPQAPWAQQSSRDSQPQPPWVQQPQQKPQAQPPWVQQVPESQPQPPWVQQPQHQAPQQAWPQPQSPGQPQPPWVTAQPQQQQPAWAPSQAQAQGQPPWIQANQAPPQPQANLNPWAPVPPQAQPQQPWVQAPPEHSQQPMNAWGPEQNQSQQQPPWVQPAPPQPTPQPNWQQSSVKTPPQPPLNNWSPAQTQPPNSWAQPPQQTPVTTSIVNTRPSPKPWQPPQNRSPPPPPQRMSSFTLGQRTSSPINPMATVLNPSSAGSAFEMPTVKGKGADMFAKRQSRMEKFVVDSETVEANKASRSASPVASLPTEWKYTPNVRAPPPRAYNPIQSPLYPPAATKQPPPSSSPSSKSKKKEKPAPPPKPLNVIDVMKHQPYHISSSLFTFGPAEEAKPPAPKPECPPPNPPVENQPHISYEQMAPIQQPGQMSTPYPQQAYGMPMQPMMHEGHYQQPPPNMYAFSYQQPPGPYQQMYNQPYQQPPPPAFQPQIPQSPTSPYQQALQPPYPPANSPPYMAAPSVPYQSPNTQMAPSYPVAARPESASGGNPVSAPKPKFTAKKSSAQVWKPTGVDKE